MVNKKINCILSINKKITFQIIERRLVKFIFAYHPKALDNLYTMALWIMMSNFLTNRMNFK